MTYYIYFSLILSVNSEENCLRPMLLWISDWRKNAAKTNRCLSEPFYLMLIVLSYRLSQNWHNFINAYCDIVKDHGELESCVGAHCEGNSWRFENMKTISGNGPVGTFSCVAINNIDFDTRKKPGKHWNFKIAQNASQRCQTTLNRPFWTTFIKHFVDLLLPVDIP